MKAGLARRRIQVSYAIGEAKPMSVTVETFGTGDAKAAAALKHQAVGTSQGQIND